MEDGENLRARIDCQPEPEHLRGAAQPCSEFIQLEVRELEVTERVLVQGLHMLTSAEQPGGDSRLTVAEDPLSGARIQPFCERSQHHFDLPGGSFQAVQRCVESSAESGVTGLATKCLDLFSVTMCAIPDSGVDRSLGDSKVQALLVRAGKALSANPFRCSPSAFDLRPGTYWRSRWTLNRREG